MDMSPVNSAGVGSAAAFSSATPSSNTTASTGNDVSVRQVISAINEVNKSELMGEGKQLNFTRDPDTHRPVIQIVDQNTGEVLDQLPPESIVRLAEQLK
jgi:flagellar protein FlaG